MVLPGEEASTMSEMKGFAKAVTTYYSMLWTAMASYNMPGVLGYIYRATERTVKN